MLSPFRNPSFPTRAEKRRLRLIKTALDWQVWTRTAGPEFWISAQKQISLQFFTSQYWEAVWYRASVDS